MGLGKCLPNSGSGEEGTLESLKKQIPRRQGKGGGHKGIP